MRISPSHSCIPNIVCKLVIVNKEEKPDYIINRPTIVSACAVQILLYSCKQASQA